MYLNLKEKWSLLKKGSSTNGFTSLRISATCISEIFIAVSQEGHRCLILSLPERIKANINSVIKEKLSLIHYSDTNYLVLALHTDDYIDLFDDLIRSLYNAIYDIPDDKDSLKIFIQTFYKWSEFFEDEKSDRLSKDIIKGIFGELWVLKSLLEKNDFSKVNDILGSWKGPYDQGHDFILDEKDIEVKTKDISKLDIRISSEYQLENDHGKALELLVVSVEDDIVNGTSIKDIVIEIKNIVINMLGDVSILLKALRLKGLTLKNIGIYDNYRFKPVSKTVYDCDNDKFPKLIRSEMPSMINNVKYNIRLNLLKEFILRQEDY